MHHAFFTLALVALSTAAHAASACTGQQYNDLPGFPASNSGCYPLGYASTSDLGQTSPADAQQRCQQQCTSQGNACGSVVAQVNKAADSNLYSGTCFYYAPGQTPTGPRQCANTAYLLLGYKKDSTLACFSSSSVAATSFCSSYLSIPQSTSTKTVTPAPVTTTSTATATTSTTVVTTSTSTITATTTTTQTVTAVATNAVTVTAPTTTVTFITTLTLTTSSVTTSTATVPNIATTVTVYNPPSKRAAFKKRAAAAAATPACVTSNTPSTRLSAACSCLSITPSTSTTTRTLTAVTSTVTQTTTQTNTGTSTTVVTTTPTTSTVTATQTVTSTSNSVTTQQATTTLTLTAPAVFTTLVSTSTVTVTAGSPTTVTVTAASCPSGPATPSAITGSGNGGTYNYMCCANAANTSPQSSFDGEPVSGSSTSNVNEQTCANNCAGEEAYGITCLGFTFTTSGGLCVTQSGRGPIVAAVGSTACYQV